MGINFRYVGTFVSWCNLKAIDIVLYTYSIVSLYELQKSTPESNLSEASEAVPQRRVSSNAGGEAAKIGASTLIIATPEKVDKQNSID